MKKVLTNSKQGIIESRLQSRVSFSRIWIRPAKSLDTDPILDIQPGSYLILTLLRFTFYLFQMDFTSWCTEGIRIRPSFEHHSRI